MTRSLAAAAFVLAAALAPSAQTDAVHTFQVVDGQIHLDGRLLPDALPPGMDLGEQSTRQLEFSGPVVPVLEIDGEVYVLEDERLVPLTESSRADRSLYVMSDPGAAASEMPQERMMPIVEAAYLRDVAASNGELYDRMRREMAMEQEVERRAARIRGAQPGSARQGLVSDLRGLLSDLLALKHEIRAQEIEIADQRLDSARRGLVERQSRHDEIVDGRLRELVGDL